MKVEYEVWDEYGQYGVFKDNLSALMGVNKLIQRGNSPRLYEVHTKEVDWEADLRDLFGGPGGM